VFRRYGAGPNQKAGRERRFASVAVRRGFFWLTHTVPSKGTPDTSVAVIRETGCDRSEANGNATTLEFERARAVWCEKVRTSWNWLSE
jgi:hypothetical protein